MTLTPVSDNSRLHKYGEENTIIMCCVLKINTFNSLPQINNGKDTSNCLKDRLII